MEITKRVSLTNIQVVRYLNIPKKVHSQMIQHRQYDAIFFIDDLTKELVSIRFIGHSDLPQRKPKTPKQADPPTASKIVEVIPT